MHKRTLLRVAGSIAALILLASLVNYLLFRQAFVRWHSSPIDGQVAKIEGAEIYYRTYAKQQ